MILPTFTIQIGSVERKMSCEIQGTSRKYGKNAGRPYGLGEGGGDNIFSKYDQLQTTGKVVYNTVLLRL